MPEVQECMAWPPEPGRWPRRLVEVRRGRQGAAAAGLRDVCEFCTEGPKSETTDPGPVRGDLPKPQRTVQGLGIMMIGFRV